MMLRRMLTRSLTATGSAVAAALALAALAPSAHAAPTPNHAISWRLLHTGTPSHFRGLSPVSRSVAWLGGYDGVVLRTVDGGQTWRNVSPAGASALQFRDIAASDAAHAVAMAAGSGTDSRLYVTSNGGRTWQVAYQNTNPTAFFDCMSFSDSQHGLVVSDPVGGKFRILSTRNGGHSWSVNPRGGMPSALTGEAAFAASGQCLTTVGRNAWFGTGGAAQSRVFHSGDNGHSWSVSSTPVASGPTAGIFGLAFRTPSFGVVVGGDFVADTVHQNVSAVSVFKSPWFTPPSEPGGYRSGVTWVPHTYATVLAVGLTGSDVSYDGGVHWRPLGTGQFDTVSCAGDGACWASGDLGRVAVLQR